MLLLRSAGARSRLSSQVGVPARAAVELGDHLAVGVAGGVEFFAAFLELAAEVDDFLLQLGDPPLELVDVLWGAEPGLAPCLLAEHLRQLALQLADAGGLPGDLGLGIG
jgi:hypothetical protein